MRQADWIGPRLAAEVAAWSGMPLRPDAQFHSIALPPTVGRVEDWVTAWAHQLAEGLMTHGAASLSTPGGSVKAWLRRPHGIRRGELRIEVAGPASSGSSVRPGLRGDDEQIRREVHDYLTVAVLDLAGM